MQSSSSSSSWRAVAFAAFVSSCTAATLGYDVGIMADAIELIRDTLDLSTGLTQLVVGSLNFTSAFGTLLAGQTSDMLGRKKTVLICCLLYILGTFMMTVAQGVTLLLLGRIVTGLGVGVSFVVTPVYITEISPSSARGMLSTCFDISINGGIVLGYVVGFCIMSQEAVTGKEARWRLMLALGGVLPVFVAFSLAFLPESPRWLFARGRPQEAFDVLLRFLGDRAVAEATLRDMEEEDGASGNGPSLLRPEEPSYPSSITASPFHPFPSSSSSPPLPRSSSPQSSSAAPAQQQHPGDDAAVALAGNEDEDEDEGHSHEARRIGPKASSGDNSITWRQLLLLDALDDQEAYLRGVVFTVIGIGFWQQASGSEAVLYYSSIFLEQAGLTSVRQRLGGYILIGLCKLFPEAIVMLNVDKVGRKPLMIASSMGVTVIIAALGVIFLVDDGGDSGASSVSVVILLSLCKSLLQNADLPD